MNQKIQTVSELTRSIRSLLETRIGEVWVEGEISNLRRQSSGHQYFTLKDERAQLSCVLFRSAGQALRQSLADGMCVQVFGLLTVYDARGQYQLVAEVVQPKGMGDLQARFEALKRKLEAEGLFDPERKKPIPRFPRQIAIVTSPTGAAIRDMLNVLNRRAPWLRILISPVRVQGEGAALEIASAVRELNTPGRLPGVDLIVLARGGGSLEDLWAFNEESAARAIAESRIPIVSAVGHEIDFTIADFAADLRAPTPSAAAELIVPDEADLRRHLARLSQIVIGRVREQIGWARARVEHAARSPALIDPARLVRELALNLDAIEERLTRAVSDSLKERILRLREAKMGLESATPRNAIGQAKHQLERIKEQFVRACQQRLQQKRHSLEKLNATLRVLGPQATLERGFTITSSAGGRLLVRAADARGVEELVTQFSDGEIRSVQRIQKKPAS